MAHGPPMVSGFLGTLISLERAVALGRRWGCAAPLLTVRLIGDSAGLMALRRWGGLINAAAILFFLTTMVYSMIHRPAPVASDPVEL